MKSLGLTGRTAANVPFRVLLISGPSASGKTYYAYRLLSLEYEVVTESLDAIYRVALQNAGVLLDPETDRVYRGAHDVYRTAHELRAGKIPEETAIRFWAEFDAIVRNRIEIAYALGQSAVFEGYTLKFPDETSRIAKIASEVTGGNCRVLRASLKPDRQEWERNRAAWARTRGRRKPGPVKEQYFERKMERPEEVPGVSTVEVSNREDMTILVGDVLRLERQVDSRERLDLAIRVQRSDNSNSRFRIQIAEKVRLVDRLKDLLEVERTKVVAREDALETAGRELTSLRNQVAARGDALETAGRELTSLHNQVADRYERIRELEGALEGRAATTDELAVDLAFVRDAVERAITSRSWRLGHWLARALSLLALRKPKREGALEAAHRHLQRGALASAEERAHPSAAEIQEPPPSMVQPDSLAGPLAGLIAPPVGARAEEDTREAAAWRAFLGRYSRAVNGTEIPLHGCHLVVDRRGVLLPAGASPAENDGRSVDVVVCVHDALPDVHRCLRSLLEKTDPPFHLIIVNDGSDDETSGYLEAFAAANEAVTLIDNHEPPHGYTIAANLGVSASRSDYVVLLNSDTVVTLGWLERLIACAESDPSIGILGPLSNAASHQSVPELREGDAWAVNELPPWLTPDAMAFLVRSLSEQVRPRFPFINGFCYVVKREVIERIGLFDAETFTEGYSEENDFSYRAAQVGLELAVADDAYVYHAKTRSYGAGGRQELAKRNYKRFLEKHGERKIRDLVSRLESDRSLAGIRAAVGSATSDERALRRSATSVFRDPLHVTFVLPGLARGSSGGAHSIYQEVMGMRELGIPARIAVAETGWGRAKDAYENAADVFVPFGDEEDLARKTAEADVLVATHFKSVQLIQSLCEQRRDFLPAYYIQDYEPFFFEAGSESAEEATSSYTAIPDQLLFAKTHWVCELVGRLQGVHVARVEPSLDRATYHHNGSSAGPTGPVVVTAMIRPRTPRRQPLATLRQLQKLKRELGSEVEVVSFGCSGDEVRALWGSDPDWLDHRGLLRRAEVAELLGGADIFLDCSFYQAFGRTGLEAMACGCTAVMPMIGGAHEFAVSGENSLLVDTRDRDAVHQALTTLVADPERLRRLQQAASETAGRYSVTRAALSEYVLFEHCHRRRTDGLRQGAGRRA